MSFFQIPGNIKQQFVPFVLNPDSPLHSGVIKDNNKQVGASTDLSGIAIAPQYFTYKNKTGNYTSGCGKINFYPSSLNSWQFADDISYKLLYAKDYPGGNETLSKRSITINDILNAIPGIQIREFLPDTRLDQCINFFTEIIGTMSDLMKSDGKESQTNSTQGKVADQKEEVGLFKKISAVTQYSLKYMVGVTNPDFFDDLNLSDAMPFSSYNDIFSPSGKTSPGFYIMTFPYTLYYRLQSCVTTNIYEIPGVQASKTILHSEGEAGWTSGGDMLSEGGLRISDMLGKIPGIGQIANMVLGNIGINYMPWWNASAGAKTKMPQIEITFDLFNDTANAALMNFIFVNTLIPNNMWVQYNMFQHSSSVYDVKIEGINRLYACAGNFDVTYEGVLRDPPVNWYQKLKPYFNKNMSPTFEANIKNNKLIKIPDIYRVKMVFQSLLPANFNNYIFNYAENGNHITAYGNKVYDSSILSKNLPQALGKYIKRAGAVWKSGKEEDGNTAV